MRFGMMLEEDAAEGVTGYIKHHLTHFTLDSGRGAFWSVHIDSIFFTLFISFVFILVLSIAARRATSGVPGKFQAAVELKVDGIVGVSTGDAMIADLSAGGIDGWVDDCKPYIPNNLIPV